MIKKTITYTDYNGVEHTEDFYFNISRAEMIEMQYGTAGGYNEMLQAIVKANDVPAITAAFTNFIKKAYGEKSLDGKRFIKSEEISEAFMQTDAYSELIMELITDTDSAIAFVNGCFPSEAQVTAKDNVIKLEN